VIATSTLQIVLPASLGIAGTLLGTAIGWVLNERSASRARDEERALAREDRVREREVSVAHDLDAALRELGPMMPAFDDEQAAGAYWQAHIRWQTAFATTGILRDPDLADRYEAVGHMLFCTWATAASKRGDPEPHLVELAAMSARQSIAAFLREEPLPPPTFPPASVLREEGLARMSARGIEVEKLYDWLSARDEHSPPSAGLGLHDPPGGNAATGRESG
jgi:hypothetical protein